MTKSLIPLHNASHRHFLYPVYVKIQQRLLFDKHYFSNNYTNQLEQAITKRLGMKYAIACSSATAALYSLSKALQHVSDSPITHAHISHYTYQSVFGALEHSGLKLVKTEIDDQYLGVWDEVKEGGHLSIITGLLGQNTYTLPQSGIKVLDASQNWQGLVADTLASQDIDHVVISFDPTKSLGSIGNGGMLLTNDESVAKYARHLTRNSLDEEYLVQGVSSLNFKLSESEAMYLVLQLPFMDVWMYERQELAQAFDSVFGRDFILNRDYKTDEFQKYAIRTTDPHRAQQVALELGIETKVLYKASGRPSLLSLPIYPNMNMEEMCERYAPFKKALLIEDLVH